MHLKDGCTCGQMERQDHHVEDGEDKRGDVLLSVILHHLLIHNHQRLQVEFGVRA